MINLIHSPNCCCSYCESKKQSVTKEESLQEGVINRKPLNGPMDGYEESEHLTSDWEKEAF